MTRASSVVLVAMQCFGSPRLLCGSRVPSSSAGGRLCWYEREGVSWNPLLTLKSPFDLTLLVLIILCCSFDWDRFRSTFSKNRPLGGFFHRVAMSVCLRFSLCVPSPCNFFRPLIDPQVTWSGCPSQWHHYPLSFTMASVLWKCRKYRNVHHYDW